MHCKIVGIALVPSKNPTNCLGALPSQRQFKEISDSHPQQIFQGLVKILISEKYMTQFLYHLYHTLCGLRNRKLRKTLLL